jgi:glycosyltransferase involved in cell wall biosynthesis
MGDYCRREYGVTRTLIVPCGVHLQHFDFTAEDRARIRRALGLEDRFVFVYSGGTSPWQCIHETIQFYLLSRTLVLNAFFLILSPDVDAWRDALRSVDPAEYRIVSLPHSDVGRYLCGGDAAFLLRSRSPVNIVSSPVKFAEYLAAGLPIITSAYVGDYSSMVHDETLGVVIDPGDRSTWLHAIYSLKAIAADPLTRARCRGVAERLSWERIAENVRATLDGGDPSVRGQTAAAAG